MRLLAYENLAVGYHGKVVAEVPDIYFDRGEIVGLCGASGSGKTTLISTMAGMIPEIAGTILLGGKLTDLHEAATVCFRTFQDFPLLHWLDCQQNLALAAKLRRREVRDEPAIFRDAAAEHLMKRKPLTLSGGERARISLAIAIAVQAELLLLDEPFNGLDALVKSEVMSRIFSFARNKKKSVLFVSHQLNDLIEFADRIYIIQTRPGASNVVVPSSARSTQDLLAAMRT